MRLTPIIIATGAAIAIMAMVKSKSAQSLNYIFQGIRAAWQGSAPVLSLQIGVQNPTNQSFLIKSIVGSLYSAGTPIGNVSSFTPVNIAANNVTTIPVNIRLSLIGIATDLFNLIKNGNGQAHEIEFSGYVNADNISVPLKLTYKVF